MQRQIGIVKVCALRMKAGFEARSEGSLAGSALVQFFVDAEFD
jgi:hypothetical protein